MICEYVIFCDKKYCYITYIIVYIMIASQLKTIYFFFFVFRYLFLFFNFLHFI